MMRIVQLDLESKRQAGEFLGLPFINWELAAVGVAAGNLIYRRSNDESPQNLSNHIFPAYFGPASIFNEKPFC